GPVITMEQVVSEDFGQQLAFVNQNSSRRTVASLQKIWHHTGVELMPMIVRPLLFRRPFCLRLFPTIGPAGASHFVGVTEIPVFHDVVDAHSAIAIVVIIRLPDSAE